MILSSVWGGGRSAVDMTVPRLAFREILHTSLESQYNSATSSANPALGTMNLRMKKQNSSMQREQNSRARRQTRSDQLLRALFFLKKRIVICIQIDHPQYKMPQTEQKGEPSFFFPCVAFMMLGNFANFLPCKDF